ncbi:MAG: sigma factor-like helix-turn-helix DNA-binding protein [Chloroflexota bacterium]
MTDRSAIVLFGDVADSRADAPRATAWLRTLSVELDRRYADARLARFAFTQGDELQGLVRRTADPTLAVLHAALHPHGMRMRWVAVAGAVEAGSGPATERTGPAFIAARDLVAAARRQRDGFLVRVGEPATDALLDDIAPTLAVLLGELTTTQRAVARLLLVDGLKQAEAAKRLAVSRPTVSVAAERARVREIARLVDAVRLLLGVGSHAAVPEMAGG